MAMTRRRMTLQKGGIAGLQEGKDEGRIEGRGPLHPSLSAILPSCNSAISRRWKCNMRFMRVRRLLALLVSLAALAGTVLIARPSLPRLPFVIPPPPIHAPPPPPPPLAPPPA